jgi:hypothetical protein
MKFHLGNRSIPYWEVVHEETIKEFRESSV